MFLHVGLIAALILADLPVNTQISGCRPDVTVELTRLLEVELTGRMLPGDVELTITCSPADIELIASDRAGTRERLLDPAMSERTVALAAVELIDALQDTVPGRPATPQPVSAEPDRHRSFLLSVNALAGMSHEPAVFDWGGSVAGDVEPFDGVPELTAHLDVLADRTQRDLSRGTANLTRVGVGAALGWRTTGQQWRTEFGAGLRGGPVFVSGDAEAGNTRAHSGARLWLGPMLRAGVHYSFSERLVLLVGAEAGLVAHSVALLVDGTREASLNGAWLLGTVGIGWDFFL